MKEKLKQYYSLIMLILFIIYNIFLSGLKIGGLIYIIFTSIIILLNAFMLFKFRKEIKLKKTVLILFIILVLFSKNTLQFYFVISNILMLIIVSIKKSIFVKILTVLMVIGVILLFNFIKIGYLYLYSDINEDVNYYHVYDEGHYKCNNNVEYYNYSSGAFDKMHFGSDKTTKFINNKWLHINYVKSKEVTKEEYNKGIKKCTIVKY